MIAHTAISHTRQYTSWHSKLARKPAARTRIAHSNCAIEGREGKSQTLPASRLRQKESRYHRAALENRAVLEERAVLELVVTQLFCHARENLRENLHRVPVKLVNLYSCRVECCGRVAYEDADAAAMSAAAASERLWLSSAEATGVAVVSSACTSMGPELAECGRAVPSR